jgi:NAD(P)-dependent dehydrogenase (short-subunit alcohol dehydrogenase family)
MSRPPAYDVAGRTVFVTGAARGIGAAAAERLHARGANVALVGLEPERLQALAARLGEARATWFEADVTDLAALHAAVAKTVQRFGGIDVAIANAGVAFPGALATAPPEEVERTLAVNLLGVWRTDRAVLDQIVARRGYLLNVASLAALLHAPLLGGYVAAKAGVDGLSDALRAETASSGARVGAAYFGYVDTDLVRAGYARSAAKVMNARLPAFIRDPVPLRTVIDAIERGVERRAARIWAPRWVQAAFLLRGPLQPLLERGLARDSAALDAALDMADPAQGAPPLDPVLGVSADALEQSGTRA